MTDKDINYAQLADMLREASSGSGDHLWLAAAVVDQVDSLKSLIAYQREQIAARDGTIGRFQRTVARQERHIARADTDVARLRRALESARDNYRLEHFNGETPYCRVLAETDHAQE